MKRLFAVAAALLLCGALTACGGQEEPSGVESQVSVACAQEESAQPDLQPEPRAAEESSAGEEAVEEGSQEEAPGALVLTQQDSGAEAGYEPPLPCTRRVPLSCLPPFTTALPPSRAPTWRKGTAMS